MLLMEIIINWLDGESSAGSVAALFERYNRSSWFDSSKQKHSKRASSGKMNSMASFMETEE